MILYWLLKHPVFYSPPSLIDPLSPNTISEAGRGYLPLTVQRLCNLQEPCHSIGHQVLPSRPLSREAEEFPRVTSVLNMCPAHIANLLPTKIYYLVGSICVLGASTLYCENQPVACLGHSCFRITKLTEQIEKSSLLLDPLHLNTHVSELQK